MELRGLGPQHCDYLLLLLLLISVLFYMTALAFCFYSKQPCVKQLTLPEFVKLALVYVGWERQSRNQFLNTL